MRARDAERDLSGWWTDIDARQVFVDGQCPWTLLIAIPDSSFNSLLSRKRHQPSTAHPSRERTTAAYEAPPGHRTRLLLPVQDALVPGGLVRARAGQARGWTERERSVLEEGKLEVLVVSMDTARLVR